MTNKILIIFIFWFFPCALCAGEGQANYLPGKSTLPDTITIEEVEVVAARKPAELGMKITRPDSLAVLSCLTTDLSEILSHFTPVFIKSYGRGSQATAHFRGTSASHSQIIWNGLNLNSPMRGYTDLSQLPLFFVDGISLLHGGSSLTEGSGALGGTIQLSNKPDWTSGNTLTAVAERGSFSTGRYMVRLQLGNSGFRSVTRMYLESSENDFPFYNAGVLPGKRDTLENGDFQRKALLQEFYYRFPSDLSFSLRGWFQDNDRNLPPLMSYEGGERTEYQHDKQFRIQAGISNAGRKLEYRLNSGYSMSEMSYFLSVMPDDHVIRDATSHERSFDNQFRINYAITPAFSFSGSAEANYHLVEAAEKTNNPGYSKERFEGGVLLHMMLKPSVMTGFYFLSRSEVWDRKWVPFIPSAGGEWQFNRKNPILLKMNVTRNYHKPGLNDLYWIPGGNPQLLPEEGFTGELSVSVERKRKETSFRQELSVYGSEIKNWIIWQPSASGAWYWEAANMERVLSRGIEYEFSGKGHYRKWQINLSGNYAFTRTFQPGAPGSADQSRKKQLMYIPKHAANIHLMLSRTGWSALADVGFTGRRYTQSSGQTSYFERILTPFWLTNISLNRQMSGKGFDWGIRAKIENLFNVRYQQILWRPMPERNYSLTLFLKFAK